MTPPPTYIKLQHQLCKKEVAAPNLVLFPVFYWLNVSNIGASSKLVITDGTEMCEKRAGGTEEVFRRLALSVSSTVTVKVFSQELSTEIRV